MKKCASTKVETKAMGKGKEAPDSICLNTGRATQRKSTESIGNRR